MSGQGSKDDPRISCVRKQGDNQRIMRMCQCDTESMFGGPLLSQYGKT